MAIDHCLLYLNFSIFRKRIKRVCNDGSMHAYVFVLTICGLTMEY